MFGEDQRNVGFFARNVGCVSGFWEQPDISLWNRISGLERKCRECQVSLGEESFGELEKIQHRPRHAFNPLIIRDLNDVGH
jgi:hypothetical protein